MYLYNIVATICHMAATKLKPEEGSAAKPQKVNRPQGELQAYELEVTLQFRFANGGDLCLHWLKLFNFA